MIAETDRPATLADFREQAVLDGRRCAAAFEELCIDSQRLTVLMWLDVHATMIVPRRLDYLKKVGASEQELALYAETLDFTVGHELRRFHNTIGPIELR